VTDHNNKNGLNQNMGLAYTLSYKMEFWSFFLIR
jgi:hypothetical protein